jgi:uncharacterized protein YqhQ
VANRLGRSRFVCHPGKLKPWCILPHDGLIAIARTHYCVGVMSLAESLSLGMRALTWSTNQQLEEEDRIDSTGMGITVAISVAFSIGLFFVLPAMASGWIGRITGATGFVLHVYEGLFRLSIFLAYLLLISLMKDIRRLFQYHGAEHKAIATYENGVQMSPEVAQRFSTEHVRCGTNFLLTVMVLSILIYSLTGRPVWYALILSRVVLLPVIAGVAFEIIRFSARHMRSPFVRTVMLPGLMLQRITTREPDEEQIEVAIAAAMAVMTADQRAEVAARTATESPLMRRVALATR